MTAISNRFRTNSIFALKFGTLRSKPPALKGEVQDVVAPIFVQIKMCRFFYPFALLQASDCEWK